MTVSDWSQSIYLLTDSQLVRGNAVIARREKNGGSERLEGWRVRGLQIKKGGRGQVRRGADTEGIESER